MELLAYDMQGNQISWDEFEKRGREDPMWRTVGKTTLPCQCWVSTVLLGFDHNFSGLKDKPIIFETMISLQKSYADKYYRRYSTLEEAKIGHDRIVTEWIANNHSH
jgi:hypothetical protein